jgi:quercetin dioxygenase-like cupin family protein
MEMHTDYAMMRPRGYRVVAAEPSRRSVVHRCRVLLSVVAVMLLGVLALRAQPVTVAQEATPSAEMSLEGLSFTLLGIAPGVTLPGAADLEVARVGFAPGAGFPFDAGDPTGALVIIESGAITARVEEQTWTISRGAALQQAMEIAGADPDLSGVLEEIAMGEEATLAVGDVAYVPGGVSGEVRNTGEEHAAALIVLAGPAGMTMGEATPAP